MSKAKNWKNGKGKQIADLEKDLEKLEMDNVLVAFVDNAGRLRMLQPVFTEEHALALRDWITEVFG